jgi:hypothetical protein
MMWFPRQGTDYDAPEFALEHENHYGWHETAKDFWRVFQVAAPLRVFVGYARTDAEERMEKLVELRSPRWRGDRFHRLPKGEDILLVGHRRMQNFEDWCGAVWTDEGVQPLNRFMKQRVQRS